MASQNELIEELGTISESEEDFYNRYKDNVEQLLDDMNDNGWGLIWDETTRLNYTKLFFSHIVGNPISYVASIWEPSKVRLVYDPNVRTSYYYNNALSAKETCELLKISKQQLHYYVKTGQIKKEFNPDKPNGNYRYNSADVYVLQKKLAEKYEKHNISTSSKMKV